jgi:hypothetical protein
MPNFPGTRRALRPGISGSGAASTFSPDSIPSLLRWYKADAITGLNDTDPVSTWPDSSGLALDATQTGADRPTYRTNIVNGKPVVHFPGWDLVNGPHMVMPTLSGVLTMIFVVRATGAGLTGGYKPLIGSTAGFPAFHGGVGTEVIGGPGQSDMGLNDGTAFVNNVVAVPTAINKPAIFKSLVFQPNVAIASGGWAAMNRITRDGYLGEALNDRVWEGDYAEIIAYSTTLTGTELAQMHSYLSAKYALI